MSGSRLGYHLTHVKCKLGFHRRLRARGLPWAECLDCGKMIDVGYFWKDPIQYTASSTCTCLGWSTAGRHSDNCNVWKGAP